MIQRSLLPLALALAGVTEAIGSCHTPGPAFPPIDLSVPSSSFGQLSNVLDEAVENIINGSPGADQGSWNRSTTSFAIEVTSAEKTLWGYYYTAPILGEYKDSEPTNVTGDTAFRVASISKSFTVYAVLLEKGINLEDPVTKYLPELLEGEKAPWTVQWDQISIRALASQLSGISRETGLSDIAVDPLVLPDPIASGFPQYDIDDLAPCMKNSTDRACTASEIIRIAKGRPRVFDPNSRSTYSNVGFTLLGLVLEKVTGKPYTEVITSSILEPLGMNHTYLSKPSDSAGVIPLGPNDWAQELGVDIPSGGIYSSTSDFSLYLRSILHPSPALLPRSTRNRWLQPQSWTISSTSTAYGMPWEIIRTNTLTPEGRSTTIITKGGELTQYHSLIALIPDLGLGLSLLIAGDNAKDALSQVFSTLVRAAETLIRDSIRINYAATYALRSDDDADSFNGNFSLTLAVDGYGPGLRITDWVSNGTRFLPVYGRIKKMPADGDAWEARLLPSGLRYVVGDEEREVWRLTAVVTKPETAAAVPVGHASDARFRLGNYCFTDVDSLMYAGFAVEEFQVVLGAGGRVDGLVNRALRVRWSRADDGEESGARGNGAQIPLGGRE